MSTATQQLITTLDQAVTAVAQNAGIPLDLLAEWARIPAVSLQQDIGDHRDDLEEQYG